MNTKTKILLRIVETWKINERPEYRGFRCANCQKYMHKAWYHWLDFGGYKTPIHFCNNCEQDFKLSKIQISKPQIKVDKAKFNPKLPEKIKTKIIKIADSWNTAAKPVYKMFICDDCGKNMVKAYHVWANLKGILVETHFCKDCGEKLGLNKF